MGWIKNEKKENDSFFYVWMDGWMDEKQWGITNSGLSVENDNREPERERNVDKV